MDNSILSSRAIVGMYFARMEAAGPGLNWVNDISNMFNSDQSSESYGFLGASPSFREWIGGRNAKGLRQNNFSITNKHYEATLELSLRDIRRDKTGQIQARIEEFADQDMTHWASLLSTLLLNGATTTCYDGQYYFDTDHAEGSSGSQSNKLAITVSGLPIIAGELGSTTAPGPKVMQMAILKGIAQIQSFKNDQGEPMNEFASQFGVLVPTSLSFDAQGAVTGIVTAAAQMNMNPNNFAGLSVSVHQNARLNTWTDKFVVFRKDSPIKALIRQQETETMMKIKAEGSDFEFDNDAWQLGLDGWRNAGYGFWQRACLVDLD